MEFGASIRTSSSCGARARTHGHGSLRDRALLHLGGPKSLAPRDPSITGHHRISWFSFSDHQTPPPRSREKHYRFKLPGEGWRDLTPSQCCDRLLLEQMLCTFYKLGHTTTWDPNDSKRSESIQYTPTRRREMTPKAADRYLIVQLFPCELVPLNVLLTRSAIQRTIGAFGARK